MQNNANGTTKEKGLSINSQIRCFKMQTGQKQDGSMWGLITHTEKDANKNVLQKYTLWVMNDSNFIANFPADKTVDVRIDDITSVRPENKTYTKNGVKVNERVINLSVIISIVNVIDNNTYNPNNNYNNYNNQQPAQNTQYQQPQQQQPSYFDVGDNKFKNQPKQEPSPEVKSYLNDNDDVFSDDLPF